MDPLWSETCWRTFKYFIILIVSKYYILYISGIIKCLIIIDARCKHEDYKKSSLIERLLNSYECFSSMYVLGHRCGYSYKATVTELLSHGSTKADEQISGTQAGFGALDAGSRPPGFRGCLMQGGHHNRDDENYGWRWWKKICNSTDNDDNGIAFRNGLCFCATRWRRAMWRSIIVLITGPCFLYLDDRCSFIYQTGIETISITWYREANSYTNCSTNNQNPLPILYFLH